MTTTTATSFTSSTKTTNGTTAKPLRIVSLLPSATDILIHLKLEDFIVGVTHCCDGYASYFSTPKYPSSDLRKVPILTKSGVDTSQSQEKVDALVKSSLYKGISLYQLNQETLEEARPTHIITQTLCEVCAVSKKNVDDACSEFDLSLVQIVSLEPKSLQDVADSFSQVANACGVAGLGQIANREFMNQFQHLQQTVLSFHVVQRPRVLIMEWINPSFIGGHWVPHMVQYAGCTCVSSIISKTPMKSKQLTFGDLNELDPDVIIIACCGFDLERNTNDALASEESFKILRAYQKKRIYAANGGLYFARPSPSLVGGAAIIARCAFDGHSSVVQAVEDLEFFPKESDSWCLVPFLYEDKTKILMQ